MRRRFSLLSCISLFPCVVCVFDSIGGLVEGCILWVHKKANEKLLSFFFPLYIGCSFHTTLSRWLIFICFIHSNEYRVVLWIMNFKSTDSNKSLQRPPQKPESRTRQEGVLDPHFKLHTKTTASGRAAGKRTHKLTRGANIQELPSAF